MQETLSMEELTSMAKEFCAKNADYLKSKMMKRFSEKDFKNIYKLNHEERPVSNEKWMQYMDLAKGSVAVQLYMLLSPDVPSQITNAMFEKINVYTSVCEQAFFHKKIFPKTQQNIFVQRRTKTM